MVMVIIFDLNHNEQVKYYTKYKKSYGVDFAIKQIEVFFKIIFKDKLKYHYVAIFVYF